MIKIRRISEYDYAELQEAITKDQYHKDTTTPEFFYAPETFCNVYYDEKGTVLYLRGCTDADRRIRLDIQFRRNRDARRNKAVMELGYPELEERARENGFREFIFESTSPYLKKFCTESLGFTEDNNILRKEIK